MTQGKVALIDDADWDLVKHYHWTATHNRKWYAKAHLPCGTVYMHRLIMQTPEELVVHHNDNDGLNNRRVNMVNVTHVENTRLGGGTKYALKKHAE